MIKLQCFFLSFRKAARINLATSHRTLHDVDALALEPSAQLVYRLFARVSEVRRDLWVWGKVERALPCRLETKAELQRFALDFFVGRRLMLVCHTQLSFVTLLFSEVVVVYKSSVNSNNFPNVSVCPLIVELLSFKKFDHVLLLCFDWKRGVNSGAACMDMLACKLRISAGLKNYIPEFFLFSHNFKQSITILFKSQHFILTFFSSSVAWLILRICPPRPCVQPILSLVCHDLPLQQSESLDLSALAAKQIAHA